MQAITEFYHKRCQSHARAILLQAVAARHEHSLELSWTYMHCKHAPQVLGVLNYHQNLLQVITMTNSQALQTQRQW